MIPKEIIKKIQHIEIYTRRILSGSMVGDSRSAIKGSGLEFDQIREYQLGDDVRFIDWNSSTRMNKLLVKQYIEERNRTVFLAVDISASSFFSSQDQIKNDLLAQIATVLALVADCGKDHVGLLLFSDRIEMEIPIGKGRNHIRKIMEALFTVTSKRKETDINVALEYIASLKRKDTIVFLLSDFIVSSFEKYLGVASSRHEMVAVRCMDRNELHFPNVGFLEVIDPESGEYAVIDTRKSNRNLLNQFLGKRKQAQDLIFAKYKIDTVEIESGKPYMGDLIRFFRRRMRY